MSLRGLCREQGGQAQRHHAGTGRQDRPFLFERSQEIQQHKPIDEQGPGRVIAPVHLHRRQADLTGLPRKPEKIANGQAHQTGQKMPDGKTNCAHQHRQRPAHKGQRHRPARAEIRQGGNERKPPEIIPGQGNGKDHRRQTDGQDPEHRPQPAFRFAGKGLQPGLAPVLPKEQDPQRGKKRKLQTRVGRRPGVPGQQKQEGRAQPGKAVVLPPQERSQQGQST